MAEVKGYFAKVGHQFIVDAPAHQELKLTKVQKEASRFKTREEAALVCERYENQRKHPVVRPVKIVPKGSSTGGTAATA